MKRPTLWKQLAHLITAIPFFIVGIPINAQDISNWELEYYGNIELEGHFFTSNPLHGGQKKHSLSVTFEPTLYLENANGHSFTFKPRLRANTTGRKNVSLDIREAYFLTFGSVLKNEWELRVGIDQVFWGTAESNNLVNIVNQTDFEADPSGDTKLGQPMIQGTLSGEWGTLSMFILPYHRPRSYPEQEGRIRLALPIESKSNQITYKHRDGRHHVDLAARYNTSIGLLDVGVSTFKGTSREPFLVPYPLDPIDISVQPVQLLQEYHQINQVGLDLQFTLDQMVLKAEAIKRSGFDLTGRSVNYGAFVLGGEYSIYGIFESNADLALLGEWSQDERRELATSPLQNDLFWAARYTLNDTEDTTFTAAFNDDLDYSTQSVSLQFSRRISDTVSLEVEATSFLKSDPRDLASYPLRDDDYIAFNVSYGF